jgi:hypothetical protein
MPRLSPARRLAAGTVVALAAGLLGPSTGVGLATFSATSQAPSTFATAACFPSDTTPPTVDATVISKTVQYLPGYVRQGGTYHVYASASDNCAVATVRANVTALTNGQSALNVAAGAFAVGGVSYGHRSGAVTVRNPLAEGTYAYSLTVTDGAGNSRSFPGYTVVVDNTRPSGTDVQTANGGSTVGKAEAGDSITYTFSEIVDPHRVLAGWTGTPTPVVARLTNNGTADRLTIRNAANMSNLPVGTVSLAGNYVAANRDFGATGSPSVMTWTGTAITVTFGTPSGATLVGATPAVMTWPPSSTVTDRAGNASLTTTVNEPSVLDVEF